ncbi:ATP-binding cassette domain-containing protein, partial [Staphylococcus aureus]|nr:ATP-binding cassette domain-containing protein [Staphylococcus aureus]
VALLGANGAGKTSILRAISHQQVTAKGTLRFEGQDIIDMAAPAIASLGIAHVPEGRGTFGDLTVLKLRDLLTPVAHGEYGGAAAAPKGHVLGKAARDAAVERRVAAGGSAHKAAPDVRRTPNLSDEKRVAAQRLASELLERLGPLIDLGLGYISLDRSTPTLSSGELQRLRLATQLSSQLFGVVYVLDEP